MLPRSQSGQCDSFDPTEMRVPAFSWNKGGERENETRKIEGLVDFPIGNAQNCPKTAPLESGSYIGVHVAMLAGRQSLSLLWDILYIESGNYTWKKVNKFICYNRVVLRLNGFISYYHINELYMADKILPQDITYA